MSRYILIRHTVLLVLSYSIGKCKKVNFDYRKQNRSVVLIILLRAFLGMISKSANYASISFIPLTLSGCIGYCTGPIFAAGVAYILIREKLSCFELVAIMFGILGTAIMTMP